MRILLEVGVCTTHHVVYNIWALTVIKFCFGSIQNTVFEKLYSECFFWKYLEYAIEILLKIILLKSA